MQLFELQDAMYYWSWAVEREARVVRRDSNSSAQERKLRCPMIIRG